MMPNTGIASLALFIVASTATAPTTPWAIQVNQQSTATNAREQTADQQIQHVLSRLTFGARPGDVAHVREMGLDAFIAQQLSRKTVDDKRLNEWLKQFETLNLSYAELQKAYPRPAEALQALNQQNRGSLTKEDSAAYRRTVQGLRRVSTEVASARVGRAVLTERQLEEVMTDFWLNHFSVYAGKNALQRYTIAEYENRVVRPRALGKFRDLLGAVAKSPAMLLYLDNWQSAADSGRPRLNAPRAQRARNRGLNENYGRELLELHTLGVDGGYTQQDVLNVARAFTGWTFLPRSVDAQQIERMAEESGRQSRRRPGGQRARQRAARAIEERLPEPGVFYFNPQVHDAGDKIVLGNKLKSGRGLEDGEQVLDIVARHPATARHIATKLARRFVSDDPPASVIDRAAEVFTRTDGDIGEVVRAIITSPEFFSQESFRSKVKSPFEVVVSALRAVNATPNASPRTAQVVAQLGQPIYGRQTPDGWPDVAEEWMGSGAILNRINFGLAFGARRIPGVDPLNFPGADSLLSASLEKQVDGVTAAFLGGRVSPETREILLTGKNPLQKGEAKDDEDQPIPPVQGLARLVGLAVGAPEFQRR